MIIKTALSPMTYSEAIQAAINAGYRKATSIYSYHPIKLTTLLQRAKTAEIGAQPEDLILQHCWHLNLEREIIADTPISADTDLLELSCSERHDLLK